jgi:hypothetical protein
VFFKKKIDTKLSIKTKIVFQIHYKIEKKEYLSYSFKLNIFSSEILNFLRLGISNLQKEKYFFKILEGFHNLNLKLTNCKKKFITISYQELFQSVEKKILKI